MTERRGIILTLVAMVILVTLVFAAKPLLDVSNGVVVAASMAIACSAALLVSAVVMRYHDSGDPR